MKFLVVCMFALMATSCAGIAKKDMRGLLPAAGFAHQEIGTPLGAAPLASGIPVNVGHAAPVAYAQEAHPAHLTAEHTHTHTVQRVNVPYAVPVERVIIKHVPIDRPIPQPYPVEVIKHVPQPITVDRHVPQPYPVHVKVAVPKPYAVPVDHVQTVQAPQAYPVFAHHEQRAIAIEQPAAAFAAPAQSFLGGYTGLAQTGGYAATQAFGLQHHAAAIETPAYATQELAAPAFATQSFAAPVATPAFAAQTYAAPAFASHGIAATPVAAPAFAAQSFAAPAIKQFHASPVGPY